MRHKYEEKITKAEKRKEILKKEKKISEEELLHLYRSTAKPDLKII